MPVVRHFGRLSDGREVHAVQLGDPHGLQAEVLTYGAILRRITAPVHGRRRDLVLALNDIRQYENDTAFVGPVVGRFANRIAAGRLTIDGKPHQLTRNEHGNHLHGGTTGTGRQLWRIQGTPTDSQLTLALESPDGDEGYPGRLNIEVQFELRTDSLRMAFNACSDAATPVNLTCHPYFNLGGDATRHWLRIPASRFLPVGPGLIPTGELESVAGTPFDLRSGRMLQPPSSNEHAQLGVAGGYDHCWVLDADADCHCELRSPSGDLTLTISGTGPGLQFYGGQYLSRSHPDLGSGIALEPQGFPDAPNNPGFPDSILQPGSTYRAVIEYRFSQT